MKKTHRAYAGAFWLGTTLAVDAVAFKLGNDLPVHPAVVAIGTAIAPFFSSGNLSPDMDHQWAPGPPRRNYDWRGHRGFTHRFWFACVLSVLFALVPYLALIRADVPFEIASFAFAPVNGWWSHLSGDMIFGRLLILGKAYGLGWETNGLAEKGGKLWRDPAAQVSVVLSVVLAGAHLMLLVQVYG